jgi:hypothetical protein
MVRSSFHFHILVGEAESGCKDNLGSNRRLYLSSDRLCGAHSRIQAVKAPVGQGNEHADPLTDMVQRV